MLDSKVLKSSAIFYLIGAWVVWFGAWVDLYPITIGAVLGLILVVLSLVFFELHRASRHEKVRHVLPELPRDLFDKHEMESFNAHLNDDPELTQAIKLVYKLNNEDFIRFVRVCVELRDCGNQTALKAGAKHFRRNQ